MNKIEEESNFKAIDDEEILDKDTDDDSEIVEKLPDWSIEPPIEIKRGE